MNLIYTILEQEELIASYGQLISQELFDSELPNSRLKNIFNLSRETPDGIIASVAKNESGEFVGIITCERTTQPSFNAFRVKDPFKMNSKVKSTETWSFVPSGFISMYVKPKYRNKGIAKELLNNLEYYLFSSQKLEAESVPLFTAAAKAVSMIADYSIYSLPIDVNQKSSNFPSRIHFLTEAVKSMRNNEEVWSYKCSNKIPLPQEVKKFKI